MENSKKKEEFKLQPVVEDQLEEENEFNLDEVHVTQKVDFFDIDTSVSDDTDDFFEEFNRPSQQEKKITKQDILHEFQKINTKMNPELHKMLKIYCSLHDFKKNDAFQLALERYMEKYHSKTIHFSNDVNGTKIDINMKNNDKKSYNFEVRKSFFKQIKTFSIQKDLKLVELYEQAIIEYLHTNRFSTFERRHLSSSEF